MNYFNIALRAAVAVITFAMGIALVGGHEKTELVVPVPKATRADALEAELEAMNAFYKMIESNQKEAESRTYIDPSGDYFPEVPEGDFELTVGNKLKPFKDIEGFYLTSSEYDPDRLQSYQIKPEGGVWGIGVEYPMEKIFVHPRAISFATKPGESGISYEFTGEVVPKKYEDTDYIYKVMKGTLVKFKNGKEVFRSKVEFEEVSGC